MAEGSVKLNSRRRHESGRRNKLTTSGGLLLLIAAFVRSTRARGADEQLLSIRERDVSAVGPVRPVLGLISVHDDLGPHRYGVLREAAPQQDVGAARFEHPVGHGAIRTFDVDVDPGVRVDQFNLCDLALKVDRMFGVKLRCECVMRPCRNRRCSSSTRNGAG